jgi:hypothetical protein
MNSKNNNNKTAFQLMKEFANDEIEEYNNDKEILSLDYHKGLIEILNKENKMQVNLKEYKKLKSNISESIQKDIEKFNKKDNLVIQVESGKDLIKNSFNNNNKFSARNSNKISNKDSFFINTNPNFKYKLKPPSINTENNNKQDIPISTKKNGLYDEEIKLIIKKKNYYYTKIK